MKLRSLSEHAKDVLAKLAIADMPTQEINPGAVNRLIKGGLISIVDKPSPYRTIPGNVGFACITDAGRLIVRNRRSG